MGGGVWEGTRGECRGGGGVPGGLKGAGGSGTSGQLGMRPTSPTQMGACFIALPTESRAVSSPEYLRMCKLVWYQSR